MIFKDEFDSWARIPNAQMTLTVDKVPEGESWKHNVGVVTTLFPKMKSKPNNTIVMTCGPEIMMRFVAKDLMARGFSTDQIYISLERRMKCGIAQCGHCQIGSKFVCKDGPVFKYSDVKGLPDLII
jgi:NAD(P)H-flavin reductase